MYLNMWLIDNIFLFGFGVIKINNEFCIIIEKCVNINNINVCKFFIILNII